MTAYLPAPEEMESLEDRERRDAERELICNTRWSALGDGVLLVPAEIASTVSMNSSVVL